MLQTAKASTQKAAELYTGTSGWAYASWKPGFYPKDVSAKKFLPYYASQLNSVEVNYTFTKLPTAEQLRDWMAAVPTDFRFSFKAPQRITHMRRLNDCEDLLAEFVDAFEPVRKTKRMGAVLFQLPPNFKLNLERLEAFLALPALRKLKQIAFEFRNESWFCEGTYKLLRKRKVAVCIADSEKLVTPAVVTAPFHYYRLRQPGGYKPAAVRKLAAQFAAMSKAGADTYVYLMHEEEPTGALAAVQMRNKANSL